MKKLTDSEIRYRCTVRAFWRRWKLCRFYGLHTPGRDGRCVRCDVPLPRPAEAVKR